MNRSIGTRLSYVFQIDHHSTGKCRKQEQSSMGRAARRHNVAVGTVLEEAQQNLLSSFTKSAKTQHRGLKGDARAKSIATFLEKRLPAGFGVLVKSEIVDYLD